MTKRAAHRVGARAKRNDKVALFLVEDAHPGWVGDSNYPKRDVAGLSQEMAFGDLAAALRRFGVEKGEGAYSEWAPEDLLQKVGEERQLMCAVFADALWRVGVRNKGLRHEIEGKLGVRRDFVKTVMEKWAMTGFVANEYSAARRKDTEAKKALLKELEAGEQAEDVRRLRALDAQSMDEFRTHWWLRATSLGLGVLSEKRVGGSSASDWELDALERPRLPQPIPTGVWLTVMRGLGVTDEVTLNDVVVGLVQSLVSLEFGTQSETGRRCLAGLLNRVTLDSRPAPIRTLLLEVRPRLFELRCAANTEEERGMLACAQLAVNWLDAMELGAQFPGEQELERGYYLDEFDSADENVLRTKEGNEEEGRIAGDAAAVATDINARADFAAAVAHAREAVRVVASRLQERLDHARRFMPTETADREALVHEVDEALALGVELQVGGKRSTKLMIKDGSVLSWRIGSSGAAGFRKNAVEVSVPGPQEPQVATHELDRQ